MLLFRSSLTFGENKMSKPNHVLEAELKEALETLKLVLDNYRDNERKGIGMGPLFRAGQLLRKHGVINNG